MNPITYLLLLVTATAGLTVWQQTAIERVHQNTAHLGEQLLATRQAITSDRATLAETRSRLNQLRGELRSARQNQELASAEAEALTPEREGWWPSDKSYFYLAKSHLPQVRFRSCRLPIAQVNALLTRRAVAINPKVMSVSVSDNGDGESSFDYRLFEGGKLNPDMAALLGMTDTELQRTEELYAGLRRAVRELETRRLERVNPPELSNTGHSDQVVARMPNLSEEVGPLLSALDSELEQTLGPGRAAILEQQARTYFNQYADNLGAAPRDFIRQGRSLIIRRHEKWGDTHGTASIPLTVEEDYGHLFGPGAPCELK